MPEQENVPTSTTGQVTVGKKSVAATVFGRGNLREWVNISIQRNFPLKKKKHCHFGESVEKRSQLRTSTFIKNLQNYTFRIIPFREDGYIIVKLKLENKPE